MSTQAPSPDNLPRSPGTDTASAPVARAEPPDPEEDSSRALFEELDALLERMLSLPVSYAEESDSADGPQGRPDEVPLITIAEAMLDPSPPPYSAPLPPVTATDEAFAAQADLGFTPPGPPLPERPTDRPLPQPPQPKTFPLPSPDPVPAKPSAVPTTPRPASPRESPDTFVTPPSLWLLPLIWCNRVFNGCTMPLGSLGRWLRGASGRAVLGWAGLLMLAAAGGLFLNGWFGWTW